MPLTHNLLKTERQITQPISKPSSRYQGIWRMANFIPYQKTKTEVSSSSSGSLGVSSPVNNRKTK